MIYKVRINITFKLVYQFLMTNICKYSKKKKKKENNRYRSMLINILFVRELML